MTSGSGGVVRAEGMMVPPEAAGYTGLAFNVAGSGFGEDTDLLPVPTMNYQEWAEVDATKTITTNTAEAPRYYDGDCLQLPRTCG